MYVTNLPILTSKNNSLFTFGFHMGRSGQCLYFCHGTLSPYWLSCMAVGGWA